MKLFLLTVCFLIALCLGVMITPRILLISYRKRLFDIPDSRKVHYSPIPRLGGLSFFPAILIAFCLTLSYWLLNGDAGMLAHIPACQFLLMAVGCMMLYLAGVSDDLIGMRYYTKFAIQLVVAALLVLSDCRLTSLGGFLDIWELPYAVSVVLTVFVVVYIINAINLIDGIDGLASGLSIISLFVLSAVLISVGHYPYALLAVATLGVLIPFWFYNVFGSAQRGHKLFMGDAGSQTLGYILCFLVIHICSSHAYEGDAVKSLVIAFSALLVPMFDVIRVVVHRLRTGTNPFLPDQNHFHHKLLRTGLRVRQVMVTILVVSVFFFILNWLCSDYISITWLLLLDVVLWVLMHLALDYAIHMASMRKAR